MRFVTRRVILKLYGHVRHLNLKCPTYSSTINTLAHVGQNKNDMMKRYHRLHKRCRLGSVPESK